MDCHGSLGTLYFKVVGVPRNETLAYLYVVIKYSGALVLAAYIIGYILAVYLIMELLS